MLELQGQVAQLGDQLVVHQQLAPGADVDRVSMGHAPFPCLSSRGRLYVGRPHAALANADAGVRPPPPPGIRDTAFLRTGGGYGAHGLKAVRRLRDAPAPPVNPLSGPHEVGRQAEAPQVRGERSRVPRFHLAGPGLYQRQAFAAKAR